MIILRVGFVSQLNHNTDNPLWIFLLVQFDFTTSQVKNGEEIYKVEDGFLFKVKAPEGTEIEFRDSLIN